MGLISAVGRQLQHPRGLFGKLLFRGMAVKTIGHARWTADLMDLEPDHEIVEVGFGNGANVELLANSVPKGRVVGVEVSETALEMASKKNRRAIAEGRVVLHLVEPAARFPLDDDMFDRACTVATMYVVEEPGSIFTEMHRVLAPGGLAAVTFPVRERFMRFKPAKAEGFHFHELADLEGAFSDAGFVDIRTERNDEVQFGAYCILGRKEQTGAQPV